MAKLTEEARKMIAEFHPGLIATASKDGKPNVSPKGSFRVVDDEHVAFADIASPRTVADLQENPQLSALVFDAATRRIFSGFRPALKAASPMASLTLRTFSLIVCILELHHRPGGSSTPKS